MTMTVIDRKPIDVTGSAQVFNPQQHTAAAKHFSSRILTEVTRAVISDLATRSVDLAFETNKPFSGGTTRTTVYGRFPQDDPGPALALLAKNDPGMRAAINAELGGTGIQVAATGVFGHCKGSGNVIVDCYSAVLK